MNNWTRDWLAVMALFLIATGCDDPEPDHHDAESNQPTDIASDDDSEDGDGEGLSVESFDTQYQRFRLVELVDGLAHPWAVAFLPDGRQLITERDGELQLLEDGQLQSVDGVPEVHAHNQGGLLDVVIHPDFEEEPWVYLTYSKPEDDGDDTATALARGRLVEGGLEDVEALFVQDRYSSSGRHYGSRLAWTNDGQLLMSIGDRGADPPRAQDLGDHAGTVLRLNDDGTVPDDNPFVDDDEALDEIYSYGHRNIQGLVVDPDTDEIWVTEHGPRGGDEINYVEAGENYGWPNATLGLDYRNQEEFPHAEARRVEGMVDPFYEFLPTHAPSGLALVTGDQFQPWTGDLMAGGLRSRRIRRVVFDEEEVLHEEELLLHEVGRIRDVRQGPEGNLYVLSDASDASLYRLEPGD